MINHFANNTSVSTAGLDLIHRYTVIFTLRLQPCMVLELRTDANVEIAMANSIVPPAHFSPSGNQNLLLLFLIWSYAEDRKNKDRALQISLIIGQALLCMTSLS